MEWVWDVHVWITLGLVGLIWTVQVIVYPQFSRVGSSEWVPYHEFHVRKMGYLVGPMMVIEAVTGGILAVEMAPEMSGAGAWLGVLIPIGLLWAITAFWAVPLHGRLATEFKESTWAALMRCNAVRTAIWTFRGAWVVAVDSGSL